MPRNCHENLRIGSTGSGEAGNVEARRAPQFRRPGGSRAKRGKRWTLDDSRAWNLIARCPDCQFGEGELRFASLGVFPVHPTGSCYPVGSSGDFAVLQPRRGPRQATARLAGRSFIQTLGSPRRPTSCGPSAFEAPRWHQRVTPIDLGPAPGAGPITIPVGAQPRFPKKAGAGWKRS